VNELLYNIVLVDDERFELDTLEKYVPWEKMGFKIVGTAKNGREALSKIGELMPDIVITDVKMPLMDGVELARILRGLHPHLKIIFLSGYDDFSYVKSALEAEASGYLLKPLNMDELTNLMHKVKMKCLEEQLVKQSARTLAIQYVKDLLNEKQQPIRSLKIEQIQSLGLELLSSVAGKYSYSLITIDEYPTLQKYSVNGQAIIEGIHIKIEQLALQYKVLAVMLNDRQYLVISTRDPLKDILQWQQELKEASNWITLCSYPDKVHLENLYNVYLDLLRRRDHHVLLYGAGHFIVADPIKSTEFDFNPKLINAPSIDLLHAYIQQGNQAYKVDEWLKQFFEFHVNGLENSTDSVIKVCYELLDHLYSIYVVPLAGVMYPIEDKTNLYNKLSIVESIPMVENTIRQFVLQLLDAVSHLEKDKHTSTIRQIRELIEREYAHPLTIEYLAERVYISPNHLRTVFKEHTGNTILEYITDVRLNHAVEMLNDGSLKIHEIAAQVGYVSSSHFCAVFLKKRGLTPNQYRNQMLRL
jgi:two-component system response regulator YesN